MLGEMDENGDLLDAVMAFLNENAADMTVDGVNSHTDHYDSPKNDTDEAAKAAQTGISPSKTTLTTPHPQPRRRVRVRTDTRREEIVALREEALKLQDRLSSLENQLVPSHAHGSTNEPKTELSSPAIMKERYKLRAQAWQAIADVQKRRRHGAESERDRLQALVKEQKRSFRCLRRYLARHVENSKATQHEQLDLSKWLLDDGDTCSPRSGDLDEQDKKDMDELSRALPAMYLQTGAVLSDRRLDTVVTSMGEIKIHNEESPSKMSIESLQSRIVPFDVETTAEAVWSYQLTKAQSRSAGSNEKLEITDNSVRRVFSAALELRQGVTSGRGRMETRRYLEPDRVVIVESTLLDQIQVDEVDVPEFAIRKFQWTVIGLPRHTILRHSGKKMCQVELFAVDMPTISSGSGDVTDNQKKKQIQEKVKAGCPTAVAIQLEFERQSVENILMAQVTQGAATQMERAIFQASHW